MAHTERQSMVASEGSRQSRFQFQPGHNGILIDTRVCMNRSRRISSAGNHRACNRSTFDANNKEKADRSRISAPPGRWESNMPLLSYYRRTKTSSQPSHVGNSTFGQQSMYRGVARHQQSLNSRNQTRNPFHNTSKRSSSLRHRESHQLLAAKKQKRCKASIQGLKRELRVSLMRLELRDTPKCLPNEDTMVTISLENDEASRITANPPVRPSPHHSSRTKDFSHEKPVDTKQSSAQSLSRSHEEYDPVHPDY